ncbi:MAG: hypothetical protein AB1649_27400, partial [Chloroflexota bacterium]
EKPEKWGAGARTPVFGYTSNSREALKLCVDEPGTLFLPGKCLSCFDSEMSQRHSNPKSNVATQSFKHSVALNWRKEGDAYLRID